jgi:poly(A) polymerase
MAQLGVLGVILPEGDPAPLAALVAQERRQQVAPDALRRLTALLPADPALAEQVAARLRLSTAQRKRLAVAAARSAAEPDPRVLAYRLGMTGALDQLLIAGRDIAPLAGWAVPRFPLKGGDVVARGIEAGPEVARTLRSVEERWVAEGFPDAARASQLLDEAVKA